MNPIIKYILIGIGVLAILFAVNYGSIATYYYFNPMPYRAGMTDTLFLMQKEIINNYETQKIISNNTHRIDSIIIRNLPDSALWEDILKRAERLNEFPLEVYR